MYPSKEDRVDILYFHIDGFVNHGVKLEGRRCMPSCSGLIPICPKYILSVILGRVPAKTEISIYSILTYPK